MTDLRKAAEMALGALESGPELLVDWLDKLKEVREALRQALAQPDEVLAEREACAKVCEEMYVPEESEWHWSVTGREVLQEASDLIRARGEK